MRIVRYAVSLGHQHSNLCLLKTDDLMASTYRLTGAAETDYRAWAGSGLFRLSVGLECPTDVVDDVLRALRSK